MNWDEIKILVVFAAYLIGSIPTAVWFGKIFYKIDLREHGSGNAGATNALRVFGNKAGAIVLVIDALKGVAAVSLISFFPDTFDSRIFYVLYQLLLGVAALIGHVFPVFAGFRGGKGIATLAGIGIAMFPIPVLICLGVFLIAFLPTRYVSVGSLSAGLAFPITVILLAKDITIPEIVFASLVTVFVTITHRKNIKRLIGGTENKLMFGNKGLANANAK